MLKVGKIPESVLKRSVLKQIHTRRPEVILGAGVGEDCAALALEADEIFVLSTDPITGTATDIGTLAIHVTLNDLATSGAEPVGLMLTMLLPEGSTEEELKEIMSQVDGACGRAGVQIIGGHTEVTRAVNQPILSVSGVGKVKKDRFLATATVRPGDDIVITKWIGLEGTSILAKEKKEELLSRFPADFVEEAAALDAYLSVLPEARIAVSCGVRAMHDVTEGGIFGALWELAESSKVGLEIDLRKIPIRQETVEICEFFGINPYELISSGSMLMAAPDGTALVNALQQAGISAALVGKATAGRDRILFNQEEKRYLEMPKTDQLYCVL